MIRDLLPFWDDKLEDETDRDPIAAAHRDEIAPENIDRTPDAVRMDDSWARTLWVGEYPDAPIDGFLEAIYAGTETRRTDISIHIDPRDTPRTLDALENKIEGLEADREYLAEKQRAGARGVAKDVEDYHRMYDVLQNTSMEAFDTSMYLTIHAEDKDDLDRSAVSNAAGRSPANLTSATPRWGQLRSLQSASPIGANRLNESLDTRSPMLGGAVGAIFLFVAGAFAEPGIEYGTYALNESPLILDRFNRDTGYCGMVIGKLGAGKSFSTKLQLLRRAMFDSETLLVRLDPLEGFAGVNEVLGDERITVGGTRGFNPLEIRSTPEDVFTKVPDLDPWSEQISWVMTFFETFFAHIASNPLDERTQALRRAVQEAYERQDITRDPATHHKQSSTVRDVIAVLEDLLANPESFGYATAGEQDQVREDSQSLLTDLRPSFREGGDLANLARETEFDLNSRVLYLDLNQEEGTRGRTETSLMM